VHDLSHRLHPAGLRVIGLVASLHTLQRELSQQGVPITLTHDRIPSMMPPELTVCLFRVVQEAVQNAVKYSQARHVTVHLAGEPDGLTLRVADDGVGFDVEEMWGRGLGLIGMQERVTGSGGTFVIHSAPGAGTSVEVTLPLRAGHETAPMAI
jgi:signal transduction histidine kinase